MVDTTIIIANIFGLITFITYNYSMFCKTKKKMLLTDMIVNISDICEYILLKAPYGVLMALTTLCSNIAFVKFNSKKLTTVFYIIGIFWLCITYEGWITALMIIKEFIMMLLVLHGSEQQIRICSVFSEALWLYWDYTKQAYVASISEIINCIIITTAIIKYSNTKQKQDE